MDFHYAAKLTISRCVEIMNDRPDRQRTPELLMAALVL